MICDILVGILVIVVCGYLQILTVTTSNKTIGKTVLWISNIDLICKIALTIIKRSSVMFKVSSQLAAGCIYVVEPYANIYLHIH